MSSEKRLLEEVCASEDRQPFLSWLAGEFNPSQNDVYSNYDACTSRLAFSQFFVEFVKNQTQQFIDSPNVNKSAENPETANDSISIQTHREPTSHSSPATTRTDVADHNSTCGSNFTTPKRFQGSQTDLDGSYSSNVSPVTPVSFNDRSGVRYSTPNVNRTPVSFNNGSHDSANKSNASRSNLCIGDFIVNNKSNIADGATPVARKKRSGKFQNLSSNDPLINSNKENVRYAVNDREKNAHFNFNDKEMFPDIGAKKNNLASKIIRYDYTRRIKPTRLNMTFPCPETNFENVNFVERNEIKFGEKYDKVELNDAFKMQNCQLKEHYVDFKSERDILKREKEKLLEKFNELNESKVKKISSMPVTAIENVEAKILFEFSGLHDSDVLIFLSDIYAVLLEYNLIANVTSEIYYLLFLATLQKNVSCDSINCAIKQESDQLSKDVESKSKESLHKVALENIFDNISNCIYFALATLERQKHILEIVLDRKCLKFFINNKSLKGVFPDFIKFLNEALNKKVLIEKKYSDVPNIDNTAYKNVCFITDTDSADNFPSRRNFLTFKSQRDFFYDILRSWESNHSLPGWKFDNRLGHKVASLISMDDNPSNLAHLARLFRDQLLLMCAKQDEPIESLAHLQAVIGVSGFDQDKISKLAQRLTLPSQPSKLDKNDLCNPPNFIDSEEFFRDFIIQSMKTTFREHLINAFVQEICKLDQTNFSLLEKDESDSSTEQEIKIRFLACARSLRILAKFLGYLIALPYSNNHDIVSITEHRVLDCELAVRDQILPPINLINFLQNANSLKKLILTLPWIVHLLVMLDFSTLRLAYFKHVLKMLFDFYTSFCTPNYLQISLLKRKDFKETVTRNFSLDCNNIISLRLCLGWLFNMQNFPHEYISVWSNMYCNNDNSPLNSLFTLYKPLIGDENACMVGDKIATEKTSNNQTSTERQEDKERALDSVDMIDEAILKEICPFLFEIQSVILHRRNMFKNKQKAIRHITPVTSSFTGDMLLSRNKNLQMRLEEWFLRSQPATTKRILELVSDRTGAALVRLAKTQLPEYNKHVYEAVSLCISQTNKDDHIQAVQQLYNEKLLEFHKGCHRAGYHVGTKRITSALQGLLPPGTSKPIQEMCFKICTRNALRKLTHCLQTQYNTIQIFTQAGEADVNKIVLHIMTNHNKQLESVEKDKFKVLSTHGSIDNKVNEKECIVGDTIEIIHASPTMVLIDLKELLIDLVNRKIDRETFYTTNIQLLKRIRESIVYNYVNKSIKDTLLQMSIDCTIFMISLFPNLLTTEYLELAKDVWFECLTSDVSGENVNKSNQIESEEFYKLMLEDNAEDSNDRLSQMAAMEDNFELNIITLSTCIVCSKNLMIIGGYCNDQLESWSAFARFLIFLLRNNFVNEEYFTEQCLSVYREEWPQKTLHGFATCVREVLDSVEIKSKSKLNQMLNFLSDFCENLDDLTFM